MTTDRKTITISAKLFDVISTRIQNPVSGFSSVDEYVDYVLEEILFEKKDDEIDEEERKRIQDELKKLGYI